MTGATGPGPGGAGETGDEVVPVASSTVMLVRDGEPGLEVLLLERHLASDFAGGALVFPGGKVDAADTELPAARWSGPDLGWWCGQLQVDEPAAALGLLVAAVRETFEEAGVLLAHHEDGRPVTAQDLQTAAFVAARRALTDRGAHWDWRPWLAEQRLVLDLGALTAWSWWVTPRGQHRRFDTRFLLARLPVGQVAVHDEVEMTSLRWSAPQAAVELHEQGAATVIFPTRRNLLELARFPDVAAAVAAARAGLVDRRRIEPTIVVVDGVPMVQHPDEDTPEAV